MNASINEQLTVSERISLLILPALFQKDMGIVSGSLYQLTFDADIASGVLKVYQGGQLIYASDSVFMGVANSNYDIIHVAERMKADIQVRADLNDTATITENMALSIPLPISVNDSVTITENKSLSVV